MREQPGIVIWAAAIGLFGACTSAGSQQGDLGGAGTADSGGSAPADAGGGDGHLGMQASSDGGAPDAYVPSGDSGALGLTDAADGSLGPDGPISDAASGMALNDVVVAVTDAGGPLGPIAAAVCRSYRLCCADQGFGTTGFANCEPQVATGLLQSSDIESGLVVLEPSTVSACAAAIEAQLDQQTDCASAFAAASLIGSIPACTQVFSGTVPEGGPCTDTTQCAQSGVPAFCFAHSLADGGYGGNCHISPLGSLADPCITDTSGDIATLTTFNRCPADAGLTCVNGPNGNTCEPFLTQGDSCRLFDECAPGLFCDMSTVPVCKPRIPIGSPCVDVDPVGCVNSGECVNGTCVAFAPLSQATCEMSAGGSDAGAVAHGVGVALSVGDSACVVTAGGGVECWGDNSVAELGTGTSMNALAPVQVTGLTSGFTAVSAGEGGSACAVTASGGIVCWGAKVGSTPVTIATSGFRSVSAGVLSTCAVTTEGGVECWGDNSAGELGNGSDAGSSGVPVPVEGLTSGVAAVSVGGFVTMSGDAVAGTACALTTAGAVMCWGSNAYGLLGSGSSAFSSAVPVQVAGLTSGVTGISVGADFACAVNAAGAVVCWGDNTWGELENDSATSMCEVVDAPCSPVPVPVAGLSSGITAVSAGGQFACALTTTGGVQCWGSNDLDTLGYSNVDAAAGPPGLVAGLTSGVTAVSAGASTACALTSDGRVECWGFNGSGAIGNDSMAIVSLLPAEVTGF